MTLTKSDGAAGFSQRTGTFQTGSTAHSTSKIMTGMTADSVGAMPSVPLVGKKYLAKLGGMVNESAAGSVSVFARKQMEKMGWSEGKGLGKDEQGVTTYVRVKKREESMGMGVEKMQVEEQQNQWWYNVYDKLANKIQVAASSDEDSDGDNDKQTKKKKKKKASKKKNKNIVGAKRSRGSDSDSDRDEAQGVAASRSAKFRIPTDEELFAATGGKLFGRRAYGSCAGKLKRDALHVAGKTKPAGSQDASGSGSDGADSTEKKKKKKDKKDKKDRSKEEKKQKKKEKKSKKQKTT